MSEFKFTDSQRRSLEICDLPTVVIDKIEQLVQKEMLFLKNLSKIKYGVKIGSISPIRSCISKLHKLLSEFDKDDICLFPEKESFLEKLKLLDHWFAKIPKGKPGNKSTYFMKQMDTLASEIARIMLRHGIKVEQRSRAFESIVGIVFKAIGFKRRARTAIKTQWTDIENWIMFGPDHKLDEQFEEYY